MPLDVSSDDGRGADEEQQGESLPGEPGHAGTSEFA